MYITLYVLIIAYCKKDFLKSLNLYIHIHIYVYIYIYNVVRAHRCLLLKRFFEIFEFVYTYTCIYIYI